jgi:hypothetical protein
MCCVIPPASPSTTSVSRRRVEQRGLAVIYVAEHRDHRRHVHPHARALTPGASRLLGQRNVLVLFLLEFFLEFGELLLEAAEAFGSGPGRNPARAALPPLPRPPRLPLRPLLPALPHRPQAASSPRDNLGLNRSFGSRPLQSSVSGQPLPPQRARALLRLFLGALAGLPGLLREEFRRCASRRDVDARSRARVLEAEVTRAL